MATLDDLPADQRAVLQLLLRQGKSYSDLSALLRIDATAVRQRAHSGIDALVPDAGDVEIDHRAEVADYLLSQQTAPQLAATLEYLDGSAAGRRFARAASDALSGLAKGPLPDVPDDAGAAPEAARSARPPRPAKTPRPPREPRAPREPRPAGAAGQPPLARLLSRVEWTSSTLAIAGVAAVLVIVIVILVLSSGGGSDNNKGAAVGTTAGQTTTAPVVPIGQVDLRPPNGGNDVGIAFVVRRTGKLYLALQAQGLAPSSQKSAYAVWLYSSPSHEHFLGFVPTAVGSDGTMQNVSALDRSTSGYSDLLLTKETHENPAQPGTIVLRGKITKPVTTGATGAQGATGG